MLLSLARIGATSVALVGGVLFLGGRLAVSEANRPAAVPSPTVDAPLASEVGADTVVFAGGCFWGVQAVFEHVKGVKSAVSGYAGGHLRSPSYEDVSSGATGHAESVQVIFDPSQVTFGRLLEIFFAVAHDPTEKDRQGPDVGTQYRSAVFYTSDEQRRVVEAYIAQLTRAKVYSQPIVTEVSRLNAFYPAEAYHQHYAMLHPESPYIATYDLPKLSALKSRYPQLYRDAALD
jgi:peptide-methionine (S)-S-oxide reductase